jgi:hypothetical protein
MNILIGWYRSQVLVLKVAGILKCFSNNVYIMFRADLFYLCCRTRIYAAGAFHKGFIFLLRGSPLRTAVRWWEWDVIWEEEWSWVCGGMNVEKRIISREMVDRRKAIRPYGTESPSRRPVPAVPLMIEWPFPLRCALFLFASSYSNITPVHILFSDVITW